jgi:DNA-binding MarR family transcriptional regulator
MQDFETQDFVEHVRSNVHGHLKGIIGEKDTSGMELVVLIRMVANLFEALGVPKTGDIDMSGQRWSLLLRLMGEEKRGQSGGVTPTYLSRCQHVNKNTISALLRGLEDQGLVQRTLDQEDRRIFRIQLTPAGHKVLEDSAASYIDKLNKLVSELTVEERAQLGDLLAKLLQSLARQAHMEGTELQSVLSPHGG